MVLIVIVKRYQKNHLILWRESWLKTTTCSDKTTLVSKLINKRCHGNKHDKVIYEFDGLYVCRDCLVRNQTASVYEDKRGKHKNRPNKISEELKNFFTEIINNCKIEESHYTNTTKLKNAAIRLKKLTVAKFSNVKIPSKVWFTL